MAFFLAGVSRYSQNSTLGLYKKLSVKDSQVPRSIAQLDALFNDNQA
jgi:hypothetical protein